MTLKLVAGPTFLAWVSQVSSSLSVMRLGSHWPRIRRLTISSPQVMPKKGSALFWPSVTNDMPDRKDWRTTHQALKVEAGIKYGANAWFHQRDFKEPNRSGCQ